MIFLWNFFYMKCAFIHIMCVYLARMQTSPLPSLLRPIYMYMYSSLNSLKSSVCHFLNWRPVLIRPDFCSPLVTRLTWLVCTWWYTGLVVLKFIYCDYYWFQFGRAVCSIAWKSRHVSSFNNLLSPVVVIIIT